MARQVIEEMKAPGVPIPEYTLCLLDENEVPEDLRRQLDHLHPRQRDLPQVARGAAVFVTSDPTIALPDAPEGIWVQSTRGEAPRVVMKHLPQLYSMTNVAMFPEVCPQ
jgi:hypothetical protein